MPTIEREIRTGGAMQVGKYQITPQTRVMTIRFPGQTGGLIWNRPKAVIVRTPEGTEKILPVRDATRLVIWSMLAGGILGAIFIGLTRRKA